jgi:hypothetical protein
MSVGLSYACLPKTNATEFCDICRILGVAMTDIRPLTGQAWEIFEGDPFAVNNVAVVSVNSRIVLGRTSGLCTIELKAIRSVQRFSHQYLRVFLSDCANFDAVREDFKLLEDSGYHAERVAVETHSGYAGVPQILKVADSFGSNMIVDTLGLWRISNATLDGVCCDLIARSVVAHVKGFEHCANGSTHHVPLSKYPQKWNDAVLARLSSKCPLILETRAPDIAGDIEFLKRGWCSSHD